MTGNAWRAAVTALAMILAPALLGGCATALKGSTQEVRIGVSGPESATCKASNASGAWTVKAPGTVKVERSGGALSITCEAEGFNKDTRVVSSEFNGATVGNILLGGLIGVAIDAASGANYSYPETVQLTLEPACAEGDAACIATVVARAAAEAEAERKAREEAAARALASQPSSTSSAGTTTSGPPSAEQVALQAEFDGWLAENREILLEEVKTYVRENDMHEVTVGGGSVEALQTTSVVRRDGEDWVVDVTYYLYRASAGAAYQSRNHTDRFRLDLEGGQLAGIDLAS